MLNGMILNSDILNFLYNNYIIYIQGIHSCEDGEVRLVDGLDASMGRVEFCLEGEWGTVCENEWDNDDAVVVCRQLDLPTSGRFTFFQGELHRLNNIFLYPFQYFSIHVSSSPFISLLAASSLASFGGGSSSVFIDNAKCSGSEQRLEDCVHDGIDRHNCTLDHTKDAGVVCDSGMAILAYILGIHVCKLATR